MRKILLDAGHGGLDPGAQAGGIDEKDVTLDIVLATGKILEHYLRDVEVYYTRIEDKAQSLIFRHKAIMDIQPDAFVSIHCNAVADHPSTLWDERKYTEGLEIFYRDEFDLPLAQSLIHVLGRSTIWRKNRGIKQDQEWLSKKLTVLNSLAVPAVLVEIGFLSHERERQMILENQTSIAELISHGICDYLSDEEIKNANG